MRSPLYLVSVLTFLAATLPAQATFLGTVDDDWHDAANWQNSTMPVLGDTVIVAHGAAAKITQSTVGRWAHLRVEGTLTVEAALDLEVNRIDVGPSAQDHPQPALIAGTATSRYTDAMKVLMTTTHGAPGTLEALSFVVHPGCKISLHGDPTGAGGTKTSWLRLADTPSTPFQPTLATGSAQQFTVDAAPHWAAGDRVVVSSTDFEMDQAASGILQQVSGATLTLPAGTTEHLHYSAIYRGIDMRASVGLLSRNIEITSDATTTEKWGGHVMFMGRPTRATSLAVAPTVEIDWVEFTRLGKYGKLGRYPVHFHLCESVAGSYIKNCAVHDCFHRGIVVHGTDDALIEGNIVYNTYGHAYFLEEGDETGNHFHRNLGLGVRTPGVHDHCNNYNKQIGSQLEWPGSPVNPYKFFRHHDRKPAVFWISNLSNTLTDNCAAGADGYGFSFEPAWQDYADDGTGGVQQRSQHPYPSLQETATTTSTLFVFRDNTAHSNGISGFFLDGVRVKPIDPLSSATAYHAPTVEYAGCTAFKNRKAGIWVRQYGEGKFTSVRLADNAIGAYLASEGWQEDRAVWRWFPGLPYFGWATWYPENSVLGTSVMSHLWIDGGTIVGTSPNTGHDPATPGFPGSNPCFQELTLKGSTTTVSRSLPCFRHDVAATTNSVAKQVYEYGRIDSAPKHSPREIWFKGIDVYDGLIGVKNVLFADFKDMTGIETFFDKGNPTPSTMAITVRAAPFAAEGTGYRHWLNDDGYGTPWAIMPRNYTEGLTFDNCDRRTYFGTANAPVAKETVYYGADPIPELGWHYGTGEACVSLMDLDGSLVGSLNANAIVTSDNNPLAIPASGTTTSALHTGGTIVLTQAGLVGPPIGQLQFELPWPTEDDLNSGTHEWIKYVEIEHTPRSVKFASYDGLFGTQGADTSSPPITTNGRDKTTAAGAWRKRVFNVNVMMGHPGDTTGNFEYLVTPRDASNAPLNMTSGNDQPSFVVRARFAHEGANLILRLPLAQQPDTVSHVASNEFAVGAAILPLAQDIIPWSSRGYVGTGLVPAATSRLDLESKTTTHHWWDATNSELHVKFVLPAYSTSATPQWPHLSGREVQVQVNF